jgi:hypothetical protein
MGDFYPSTQRHYRRLILLLILPRVSVVQPSSSRNIVNYIPKNNLNLGCLHPVACVRSGDGGFYQSMQRHYRRLIYYLYYYVVTCFGRTAIIRQKIIIIIIHFLPDDGRTTETCSNIII